MLTGINRIALKYSQNASAYCTTPDGAEIPDLLTDAASQILRSQRIPLSAIVSSVGYESEASFSKAFKQ